MINVALSFVSTRNSSQPRKQMYCVIQVDICRDLLQSQEPVYDLDNIAQSFVTVLCAKCNNRVVFVHDKIF